MAFRPPTPGADTTVDTAAATAMAATASATAATVDMVDTDIALVSDLQMLNLQLLQML